MKQTDPVSLKALTTIQSAEGSIVKDKEGKSHAMLELTTEDGPISISLDAWNETYRGFVRCWPSLTPLKEKLIAIRRDEVAKEKADEKEKALATKKAEKEKAAKERADKLAADKAAKQKAKDDAKAKKDKEAKEAAEKKKKDDAKKLKDAADKKAKEDAKKAAAK